MNRQREFMSETFHTLAQPITAMRATIELAFCKEDDPEAKHKALADCLVLIDRLMQDLAIFREISSLDEEPLLESCDVKALVESCVGEMRLVAHESGIALQLSADPAIMQCNAPMLQRAIFLLLDEMIASAPVSGEISVSLRACDEGVILQFYPGTLQGQRRKLCSKLLHFAGCVDISSDSNSTSGRLRERIYRRTPALTLVDKQVLTSH